MNLEKALYELMKKPRSMIGADGKSHPALYYTTNTYYAIKWLVDRYNDGTLQVVGYDFQEEVRKKKLQRHAFRRDEEYELMGYMSRARFHRETGFGYYTIDAVAQKAGCWLRVNHTRYIDINKFFGYLDHLRAISDNSGKVNLGCAAAMIGISPKQTKQLIKEGKLKVNPYPLKERRTYQIYKSSIYNYLKKQKGETNGEDDSDNGEVHSGGSGQD